MKAYNIVLTTGKVERVTADKISIEGNFITLNQNARGKSPEKILAAYNSNAVISVYEEDVADE